MLSARESSNKCAVIRDELRQTTVLALAGCRRPSDHRVSKTDRLCWLYDGHADTHSLRRTQALKCFLSTRKAALEHFNSRGLAVRDFKTSECHKRKKTACAYCSETLGNVCPAYWRTSRSCIPIKQGMKQKGASYLKNTIYKCCHLVNAIWNDVLYLQHPEPWHHPHKNHIYGEILKEQTAHSLMAACEDQPKQVTPNTPGIIRPIIPWWR